MDPNINNSICIKLNTVTVSVPLWEHFEDGGACFCLQYENAMFKAATNIGYDETTAHYFRLFDSDQAYANNIPLDAYLPDLSDPSVVGATLTNPIFAKLYDQMNFDIDGKVASVSVVGCRYYWDLAKCILAQVKLPASCEEQLLFCAPEGRLIRLTERVPDTFIQSRQNPIRVNCMVKRIRVAVMDADGEPTGDFEDVMLHSDAELYNRFGWVYKANKKGVAIKRDPPCEHIHQLEDDERYVKAVIKPACRCCGR
jgi:hypothetical protein